MHPRPCSRPRCPSHGVATRADPHPPPPPVATGPPLRRARHRACPRLPFPRGPPRRAPARTAPWARRRPRARGRRAAWRRPRARAGRRPAPVRSGARHAGPAAAVPHARWPPAAWWLARGTRRRARLARRGLGRCWCRRRGRGSCARRAGGGGTRSCGRERGLAGPTWTHAPCFPGRALGGRSRGGRGGRARMAQWPRPSLGCACAGRALARAWRRGRRP
mmetsp:Transcript_1877/g.5604  ORF Transcript_1877/g.5604 Transcript_1877/m.5604 type:complete len:220 (-) Transcript_1877:870-1529(-)